MVDLLKFHNLKYPARRKYQKYSKKLLSLEKKNYWPFSKSSFSIKKNVWLSPLDERYFIYEYKRLKIKKKCIKLMIR